MPDRNAQLRRLPAIDRLFSAQALTALENEIPHALVREAAQQAVEDLRRRVLSGEEPGLEIDVVAEDAARRARLLNRPSLRRVINASGTLLHTNLGRAPLCEAALAAIEDVARGYSNLEFDLEAGERGKRFTHVESLLCRLTGGEAATVVNNNAGAVMLALAALAGGRSALVSRGELIEIGGSFRIPEIMAASGVRLVEVGATNKTHLRDFEKAVDTDTALILKVHTSNYRILGFTQAVSGEELAEFGRQRGLPVLEDLGSGLLLDLAPYGLPREPTVREALATGIDLVTFSGDKLLGGPQAGLIVGKRAVIEAIRKHPMARALRIDKLTLAALEATLRLYLDPQWALDEVPTLRMLSAPAENLKQRCKALLPRLARACGDVADCRIIASTSTVGGGALPLAELPGYVVAVVPKSLSVNTLVTRLRHGTPPVVGRVQDDLFLIDPRTLTGADEDALIDTMCQALPTASNATGKS